MPKEIEDCVAALVQEGKDKDSAYGICTAAYDKVHGKEDEKKDSDKSKSIDAAELKRAEEIIVSLDVEKKAADMKLARKIFMPLVKDISGSIYAVLSDDSIDREDEFMSKELINAWAQNKALPTLSDHKNEMDSWVGGWTNFGVIDKDGHSALRAEPMFFSEQANPKAARIKAQIEEGHKMGLMPGVSIGAIPKKFKSIEKSGKTFKMWEEAELLEASFVPVQANPNAYAYIAKRFDISRKIEGGKAMTDEINATASTENKDQQVVINVDANEKIVKALEEKYLELEKSVKSSKEFEKTIQELIAKEIGELKAEKKSVSTKDITSGLLPAFKE